MQPKQTCHYIILWNSSTGNIVLINMYVVQLSVSVVARVIEALEATQLNTSA